MNAVSRDVSRMTQPQTAELKLLVARAEAADERAIRRQRLIRVRARLAEIAASNPVEKINVQPPKEQKR